ncbi:hypothetical protein CHGG_07027 [Chaetomium globosum CBS 148.51]|uniref:Uncharacterized protein n=1 Tax=Chaetomium globosum (strain ATCC 6205 / CBS 148.51 / DSM 1962 / NBRC 6347 / NRRL 1970) TaxID=306901 RepID=Q2GYC7_CHAGB|nr:uncharacterized protein CHGG_07027 [Chaetomium globosum CBS 148.51]EAQ85774.1 hypothetical protein CHGG_07027 [Chaetomium globosum CBS 148.51]
MGGTGPPQGQTEQCERPLSPAFLAEGLLLLLSDSPDPNEPLPLSPPKPLAQRPPPRAVEKQQRSRAPTVVATPEEGSVSDAFAPGDLKKLPTERPKRTQPEPEETPPTPPPAVESTPKKAPRDVSIKSTLLADNSNEFEPTEMVLLRDLPYTLQGLSKLCQVSSKGSDLGRAYELPLTMSSGTYLTLVATLEAQIRRALSVIDESAPRGGIGKVGVTLKRCVVWTREATMGLRLMSLIAEESKTKHGGQIISMIHGFSTSHGDPVVAAFAERLLADVTRPFYDILRRWVYDGELSDPHLEFFVREQSPNDEDHMESKAKGHASVWNSKYEVVDRMVPSITTADFAQKVFLIGKSLNFIRHSCGDSQWVDAYSKTSSKPLSYGDTATLETWIDEAYKTTMRRATLLPSSWNDRPRPSIGLARHNVTANRFQLPAEHAFGDSNAQYDSEEVLRRLDARMLQLSHGDIGWDCFTLEYKIDAPVDVVVTEWGNRQYLKVFNFLWRIKRVEFALSSTWRKCMTGSRGVLQTSDEEVLLTWKSTRGVLAEMVHFVGQLQYYILFEVIESSWTELQTNIRKEDCTLDDLITAHTKYLTSITHKGLLGARRRQYHDSLKEAAAQQDPNSTTASAAASEDRNSYMIQLSELLRTMLAYRDCVDGLYSWSLSDFTRRQEADAASMLHMRPNKKPKLSGPGTDLPRDDPFITGDEDDSTAGGIGAGGDSLRSELPALQDRLRQLGASFKARLQILLGDLAYQPDVDMRFLGVSMNFNDVYQPVKRKRAGPGSAGGGAAAAQGQTQASGQVAGGANISRV